MRPIYQALVIIFIALFGCFSVFAEPLILGDPALAGTVKIGQSDTSKQSSAEVTYEERRVTTPSLAEPSETVQATTDTSEITGVVDRTHKIVSRRFIHFFRQIDDYFGSGQAAEQSKESWARVRVDSLKSAGEDARMKGSLKLRVVLPKAEKRFRLLFSTEDEQLDAGDPAQEAQTNSAEKNGFSLALRFIRQARKNGTVSLDVGARYRDKRAQIFGRIDLNHTRDLKWGFRSSFSNSFYHYSASGFENKLRYELSRPFNESGSVYLRGATELSWAKKRRGTLLHETLGIYSEIDENRALAIEGLGSYTTSLNGDDIKKFRGAEFRFRFRHNVWRRWFYYELWPSVSWVPVNDYEPSFGGMVRIETIFGKY